MAGPYPNDQGNPAGAIPVYVTSGSGGSTSQVAGASATGVSVDGAAVSNTASGAVIPAGTFKSWATIENTSATAIVYVSFNTATTSSFSIQPGAALTLAFGPKNALNGIASAAGATISAIGY
jgi:hypothetical protein